MRTIWKFKVEQFTAQRMLVPVGIKFLSAQMQGDDLCVWAEVDNDPNTIESGVVWIAAVGTGQHIPVWAVNYIGTVQIGDYVLHVYAGTLP
jgi:hypothetical protein